jgi:hypothetical protein
MDSIWSPESQTWAALFRGEHVPRCSERCHDGWHFLDGDAISDSMTKPLTVPGDDHA